MRGDLARHQGVVSLKSGPESFPSFLPTRHSIAEKKPEGKCLAPQALTNIPPLPTLVHMGKHFVQHGEQSVAGSPAPMVERAFRVLSLLSIAESGLTLSDLARALEMSKGSIHGLLKTLEANGVIEQSDERLYGLGPRIYELAQNYVQYAGLRRFALPAMQRLAEQVGETVFLGRVEREHVRIIECMQAEDASPALRISARRGSRVHLLAGATGRVVLASWSDEERAAFLATHPLPTFTSHSITDPQRFLATVAEAERSGIGEDHEEYLVGVNAVAAAIKGPGKELVALLWIVGFASRFDQAAMQHAAHVLHEEATGVSHALAGYPPHNE